MKKILLFAMILFAVTGYTAPKSGQLGLAAPLTLGGTELAISKMLASSKAVLLDVRVQYSTNTSEVEVGGTSFDGPTTTSFGFELIPEYRTYTRIAGRVSPYWGIFALVAMSNGKTETPVTGASALESTTSG